MPIATTPQHGTMIDAARADRYAYPAITLTSSETLNAALRGFAAARSDGIVEITTGGAAHLWGPAAGAALPV